MSRTLNSISERFNHMYTICLCQVILYSVNKLLTAFAMSTGFVISVLDCNIIGTTVIFRVTNCSIVALHIFITRVYNFGVSIFISLILFLRCCKG